MPKKKQKRSRASASKAEQVAKRSGARGSHYGLHPRAFPAPVQWKVDQDYLEKLTEEEKVFLARFNECFYGADFRKDPNGEWSREERQKTYRAKNTVNRDAYEITRVSGRLHFSADTPKAPEGAEGAGARDGSRTPSYLNSETYKVALEELRMALDRKPRDDARILRARDALRRVVDENH